MKRTGPACAETLSGDEKAGTGWKTLVNARGVRVEREVRRWMQLARLDSSVSFERCADADVLNNPEPEYREFQDHELNEYMN